MGKTIEIIDSQESYGDSSQLQSKRNKQRVPPCYGQIPSESVWQRLKRQKISDTGEVKSKIYCLFCIKLFGKYIKLF